MKLGRYIPKEVLVNKSVKNDPATRHILNQLPENVPVKIIDSSRATDVVNASDVLQSGGNTLLEKILAGKNVLFIAPAQNAVDEFTMPDDRMVCPEFPRLKLASNGCFYQCDWCYLKLTYRAAFPFITVRVQHDRIKAQLEKWIDEAETPQVFNSGELADSLALEHLTGAAREFIPWFGRKENAFLYMLTKSDNVENILNLPHNGHTILTWSMNEPSVSRKFEIGAPTFERRLRAARKAQQAGYRVRIRLDPIVPIDGWMAAYAETIKLIFNGITPERVTIGTLRFEDGFHKMRNSIFNTGPVLPRFLDKMEPMFEPKLFPGTKKAKSGKYSFPESERTRVFRFIVREIQRYSDCGLALCKESAEVWRQIGLDSSNCRCSCQL